jgi:RNA polymerase sigma factor (sigma-70 family)
MNTSNGDTVLDALVAKRSEFVGFVAARVGSGPLADDIVQTAYLRATAQRASLREGENATAWFYAIVRNAVIDAARRAKTAVSALERLASELESENDTSARTDERGKSCACVAPLVESLPDTYADVLRRVDLTGAEPAEVARAIGATANHVRVRLHRARKALRAKVVETCGACAAAGCRDCSCQSAPSQ